MTNQLSSLQRSLADLRAQRSSLLKQLAGATEARRAEQLRRQLQAIEARIGQTQGAIRALFSRVDYTRLALSLTPESSGAATTGGDLTPGGAAHSAAKILDAALAVLVIAAAAILPLAVVVTAGWIVVSTARRRLREQALDAS